MSGTLIGMTTGAEGPVRVTYDRSADAAHLTVGDDLLDGEAHHAIEVPSTPGTGTVVLDFDRAGRLLGVEVLGASAALRANVLKGAEEPSAP